MSEKQYASLVGFIQFDPEPKVVSGQNILNFSVRAVGFIGQPLVQVTLWSEWEEDFNHFQKGDFVAVDGQYKLNGKYHNLNGSKVFLNGELLEAGERREATSAPTRTAAAPAPSEDAQGAF